MKANPKSEDMSLMSGTVLGSVHPSRPAMAIPEQPNTGCDAELVEISSPTLWRGRPLHTAEEYAKMGVKFPPPDDED